MSFYVAGNIATETELEKGIRQPNLTNQTEINAFKAAISTNHSININDIYLYVLDEADPVVDRIRNKDSYELIWTDEEISGFDFSEEDVKKWLKVTSSSTEVEVSGDSTITITFEIWKRDLSAIDTSYSETKKIPVLTPSGERNIKVSFTNGVFIHYFNPSVDGTYIIPFQMKFEDLRVKERITIDAFTDLDSI